MEQQTSCNSQHSASIASAVTTKSDHAASPLVAAHGNSVHSSPALEPRVQQRKQQFAADDNLSRLSAALQKVLAQGLASDYVEGLRPVLHDGRLQISTYIKLAGEDEPVFIGMYPSLPAAVQAQKQSQQLVGPLPASLARRLIETQLEHTSQLHQLQQQPATADVRPGAPSRWLSNNSDMTSGGHGPERTTTAGEDIDDLTPHAAHQEQASSRQQQLWLRHTQPPANTADDELASELAGLQRSTAATAPASPSGAASAGMAPLSALTDDVINLLLRKGLHALAVVQHRDSDASSEPSKQQPQSCMEPLEDPALAVAGGDPCYPSMPAVASSFPQYPGALPAEASVLHKQHSSCGNPGLECYGPGMGAASAHHIGMPAGMSGAGGEFLPDYMGQPSQQYGAPQYPPQYSRGPVNSSQYHPGGQPGVHRSVSSSGGSGLPPRQQLQDASWAAAAMPQRTYHPGPAGMAALSSGGAYPHEAPSHHLMAGQGMVGAAAAAAALNSGIAGAGPYSRGPSDAGSYGPMYCGSMGGSDWSDYGSRGGFGGSCTASAAELKRKRSDPRLNCIKSVQYRVSRFPEELHAMCISHWERTRCARVVCNGVTGVMSVQGGRCVVSFTQHGQEVLKGVADYLRYAGEDRIKKWRRHVRMIDFARPNNRTGELMTAEEFLCIVGYQSEQGGGKRPKYAGAMDGAECSE